MLYKKEITEVNQLTKRFHRDCRRIFAQIREDIQDTALTKDEIKALIAAFGRIIVWFVISYLTFKNLTWTSGKAGSTVLFTNSTISSVVSKL